MKSETMKNELRNFGFTLVELMLVVAIIGILAAIAIPRFANLIRQASEGASKGNLGEIRSALSIYYGNDMGTYPSSIFALTLNGQYLEAVPSASEPPYHSASSLENDSSTGLAAIADGDGNGWLYDSGSTDGNYGTVWLNCTHTDAHGTTWTQY